MFKKAFSTVACMTMGYKEVAEYCQKYGMDAIEVRLGNDGSVLGTATIEEMAEMKSYLAERGLVISDIGSSVCFKGYSAEGVANANEIAEFAKASGAKAVRIFLANFASKYPETPLTYHYDGIVKAIKECAEYALTTGTEVWVETHNEFAPGKVLKKLLKDVAMPNVKIIWDIIHPYEDKESLEETWSYMGESIAHIHMKDGFDRGDKAWHDYKYSRLNEGALPLDSAMDLLKKVGFDGYLSLEWESAWRAELKELPMDMDYVLSHYNDMFRMYEENPVPSFGNAWTTVDITGRTYPFNLSANGVEMVIEDTEPTLKKYEGSFGVEDGKTYHVHVPYTEEGFRSKNHVYALISTYDAKGEVKRRMYMDRKIIGAFDLVLTAKDEVSFTIELCARDAGKVRWYKPLAYECAPIPERKVKIASVFIAPSGNTYAENLKKIAESFDKAAAKGVDIVNYAETINDRGTVDHGSGDAAFEPMDGPFVTMMQAKAKEHGIYAFFTFHAIDENGYRRNRYVLVNRQGEIFGTYDKTHPACVEYERGIIPGDEYPVFDTEFGKLAFNICWDAYFPETARAMAFKGAEILFVSTAGNPTHRHIARAKENGMYVVVSCAAGHADAGIMPTKIISPAGTILAECNDDTEAAIAEIDLNNPEYIFWLSVGGADSNPHTVYHNEYRDDMYGDILSDYLI